jgi:hypothetical protein
MIELILFSSKFCLERKMDWNSSVTPNTLIAPKRKFLDNFSRLLLVRAGNTEVLVCASVWVCERVCASEWVCVCVYEWERERKCVCACVWSLIMRKKLVMWMLTPNSHRKCISMLLEIMIATHTHTRIKLNVKKF